MEASLGLFTPGHFMHFFWSDSYPILKRPGVNALRNEAETESMSQTLNTQSSSLKVVRLTYLSSADAALSLFAVSDIEIIW